jgi:hypothetical protein
VSFGVSHCGREMSRTGSRGHVVVDNLERLMVKYVLNVTPRAGKIIIDANGLSAVLKQALAQMRAEKSSARIMGVCSAPSDVIGADEVKR